MTLNLPPQVEAKIRAKVATGLYPTTDEAVLAALDLLDDHDRRFAQLRAAIAKGDEGEAIR